MATKNKLVPKKLSATLGAAANSAVFKIAFLTLIVLIASVAFYHFYYAKKVIPGVVVDNTRIGGRTYTEVRNLLENKVENTNQALKLTYLDKDFEITGEELGLYYDVDATAQKAMEIGRAGGPFLNTSQKLAGLVFPMRVSYEYVLDEAALSEFLADIDRELAVHAQDATYTLNEEELRITEAGDGIKVSKDLLRDRVIAAIEKMKFGEIKVPVERFNSDITRADLELLKDDAQEIVFNELKIVYGENEWELTPEQMLDFLSVEIANNKAVLALDEESFKSYANLLRQDIDELPRGEVTSMADGKVTGFRLTAEGKELDMERLVTDFEKAYLDTGSEVTASVTVVDGPRNPENYGILALLGKGESIYTGSANARVHNLTLAADRTDGVLVPPGGIYSFNNSVGEISGATGYDSAYIISAGRTVLGEGGGVCQTSTTMFRAILNAGLPVVMRYPHAYRVYYYELDKPVGFDASIYQPSLDLKFRNDTPGYILVQTSYDKAAATLEFSLYGTPDGREVEITEPVVTNLVPPPEALYQDDDSLPKGTVKQVDFAAWGATSSFTWTVNKDGEILHQDTFTSRYQPWRAVYLVGTKE